MPGDAEFDAAPAWLSKAAYTIDSEYKNRTN